MSAASASKGTVLLVEDERDTREMLARAITRAGYRCVTAEDGPDAVGKASAGGGVDVVVTDVVLAADDRGGLRLMTELKTAGVLAPVVVITAYADVEKVKVALNQGAGLPDRCRSFSRGDVDRGHRSRKSTWRRPLGARSSKCSGERT